MNEDREWLALELAKMKEREIFLIANRPIEKVLRFHVEQFQSIDEKLTFLTDIFCFTEELRHELSLTEE